MALYSDRSFWHLTVWAQMLRTQEVAKEKEPVLKHLLRGHWVDPLGRLYWHMSRVGYVRSPESRIEPHKRKLLLDLQKDLDVLNYMERQHKWTYLEGVEVGRGFSGAPPMDPELALFALNEVPPSADFNALGVELRARWDAEHPGWWAEAEAKYRRPKEA